jgi:DNA-directed RNA polymerase subunit D
MDLELTLEKENKLEFNLKGANAAFSNLVRRCGMGQVPIFAIDTVTFYENSSSMFDEYVAHRLGQVPLLSDSSRASDEIGFTLEVEGPATIYSKDLKSTDSKIKASIANIPLLRLLEGQNIRLEAKARRGIGRQHAKFQPGLISYEILDKSQLKFKVESFMQLPPRALLLKTADMIMEKCDEIEEKLAEIKKSE